MRITSKAEYACLAVAELAASGSSGPPKRVQDIAEAQHIPRRYLMQILLHLKAAGLVQSVRGSDGGYQLARPAGQITVGEVIIAIEGRDEAVRRGDTIAATNLFALITEALAAERSVLESKTSADLSEATAPHDWVL
jgi:Rrf2 family protein